MTIEEQIAEIEQKQTIPDWDSYGARAVTPQAIALAKKLISLIGLGGMPNGGIEIEWDLGGMSIMIEIQPDGKVVLGQE